MAIRASDTVARYGDDHFVIVAEDLKATRCSRDDRRRVIDSVSVPLPLRGRHVRPVPSIGIAWAESGTMAAEELLRAAYVAMERARTAADVERSSPLPGPAAAPNPADRHVAVLHRPCAAASRRTGRLR